MGGFCSKESAVDKSPSDTTLGPGRVVDHHDRLVVKEEKKAVVGEAAAKRIQEEQHQQQRQPAPPPLHVSVSRTAVPGASADTTAAPWDGVSEVSSILGRASTAGLGKAVEVLDTLGSSMTDLNISSFGSGTATKGNKISILAFEVANTIVKGCNLMHALSKDSIKYLKETVLHSEGVQNLISKDMDELLKIVAADKRLASELTPQHQLKEEAESVMQEFVTSVQFTAELYHEMHALDRFQQDYQRKQHEEDGSSVVQRGDNMHILKQEVKSQHKHVKSLRKKSLWSKNLEEVGVQLFLTDSEESQEPTKRRNRLGSAGLALHYANIISQIDTLLTVSQIKAEMEKTLRWLAPIASNTTKAHHGFGWVGEWASTGLDVNCKPTGQLDLTRIETLYHADKDKTEAYILELVIRLHHLISQTKTANGERSPIKSPVQSPTQRGASITLSPNIKNSNSSPLLTQDDQDMLSDVKYRTFIPGISKSQEFDTKERHNNQSRLSKSNSHSPSSGNRKEALSISIRRLLPVIDFEIDRTKALDVIDRVDDLRVQ
ncbi:hypothetical protein ZEAMMB73_Zm00001d012257 [Zea mays]|uniref:DUF3475 domain-containing protein n=1 Tax=Zea mays TaxID=4577 RepID=A0A1D6G7U2_MAIZE|nr:hypothetical protein ZEAMMB73_Zm00001d012257 [Zea mays]